MKKLALVVDDSSLARAVLKKMLLERQMLVDTVVSAEEALVYLYTNQPDVIFMDHVMPGMDGLLAVKAIKNNPKTGVIPIMMYTSKGGDMYVSQARALGAVGVLPKQLEPAELDKTLTDLKLLLLDDLENDAGLNVNEAERDSTIAREEFNEDELDNSYLETPNAVDELEYFFESDSIEEVADNAYQCQETRESKEQLLNIFSQQAMLFRKEMVLMTNEYTNRLLERIDKDSQLHPSELNVKTESKHFSLFIAALILLGFFVFSFALVWDEKGVLDSSLQLYAVENKNLRNEMSELLARQQGQADFKVENATLDAHESNRQLYRVVEWALNQKSNQPFNEAEFGGVSIDVLSALLPKLKNTNFEGTVKLLRHQGRFCYRNFGEGESPVLAANETPLSECMLADETVMGSIAHLNSQTIEFSNYLSSLSIENGKSIKVELESKGAGFPALSYVNAQNAGEWNAIAEQNNRLEVLIIPLENKQFVGL